MKINEEYFNRVDVTIAGENQSIRALVDQVYCFPKPDQPQKVVVPKFVAEWIEEHKARFSNLYTVYSWLGQQKTQVSEWVNNNIDIFARAWLDGYEVEKEKLYTVEIPNPHINAHTILQRTAKGIALITITNARWRGWTDSKLTEAEIKQDFDWAWDAGFAELVEEANE